MRNLALPQVAADAGSIAPALAPVESAHTRHFLRLLARIAAGLLAFVVPASAGNAPVDPLVRDALAAESIGSPGRALTLFLKADAARPRNAFILQKISKQYSDLSEDVADPAEKQRLCTLALGFATRATELEPNQADNVLSIAICYGKLALLGNTRTRVRNTRLVKEYAERAVALDPKNPLAHHVLGRWNFEVARTSGTMRFLAGVVYGELPPASLAEAIRHFRRAAELEPQSPLHLVELGFALQANGDLDTARTAWAKALKLNPDDRYETDALNRAREALAKAR